MFEIKSATDYPAGAEPLKVCGWRIVRMFLDALLPGRCPGCGAWVPAIELPRPPKRIIGAGAHDCTGSEETAHGQHAVADTLHAAGLSDLKAMLCQKCRQQVVFIESPFCSVCGRVFDGRESAGHLCGDCIRQPKNFGCARSAVIYTPGFRKVVHQYKYRGRLQLAAPLGDLLLAAFLRFFNSGDMDLILPVPLHRDRFRQRGFNQAYRLMMNWKHVESGLAPTPRLLVKMRATPPQAGLGKTQRKRNIHGSFDVQRPAAVRCRRILLVDDVYTTGATADECARVLMRCGAARVDVLTLARAV